MGERTFKGRTEDAEAPFVSSAFWLANGKIIGVVDRLFEIEDTEKGGMRKNYAINLAKPIKLEGEAEPVDRVSVGESAGLRMALQAARLSSLAPGDKVVLACTGEKAAKKEGHSPMVMFQVDVTRPDL